ncbi:MAG: hypothetical protein AB1805_05325 [Nitrospirota bacterium]
MSASPEARITIRGARFDLTMPGTVASLLRLRRGRRAVARWLNSHKHHPEFDHIHALVMAAATPVTLAEGLKRILEPLAAAAALFVLLAPPAVSYSSTAAQPFAKECTVCHRTATPYGIQKELRKKPVALKQRQSAAPPARTVSFGSAGQKLVFASLGSGGYGISRVGKVYLIEAESRGSVEAQGVLFRDEAGMRLRCALGSTVPKGASVVLGSKAYTLTRGGAEWTMRNVISINGVPVEGDVFIADYYIKRKAPGERLLLQAKAAAPAADTGHRRHAPASSGVDTPSGITAMSVMIPAVEDTAPVTGIAERALAAVAENPITVEQREDGYEATSRCSGLTVKHLFRGSGAMTVHEASLAAYPELTFLEVFNVPVAEAIKNIAKYSRGVDNQLGRNIITFINSRLKPLFDHNRLRRLPHPDSRLVLDIRITGSDDYSKTIALRTSGGEWIPLSDELLTGILQSEPVSSYAEQAAR